MLTRSPCSTVVFRRPFVVNGLDCPQPAGTYDVETEEKLPEALSFPAYRRVWTAITPPVAGARDRAAGAARRRPGDRQGTRRGSRVIAA